MGVTEQLAKFAIDTPTGFLAPKLIESVTEKFLDTIGIMVAGALDYGISPWPGIDFPSNNANVDGGVTCSFTGSFIMPDSKVTIHAYSYWYGGDGWYLDDEMTTVVNLAALTPQISEFQIADFYKV